LRKPRDPHVRICGYPAEWLLAEESFDNSTTITWSTGESTEPNDIQVFGVSTTLGEAPELVNDVRRDAVHSIWLATTSPQVFGSNEWPIQAEFTLLLKLDNPVPKNDLIKAGLLKREWPQHWRGKIFHAKKEVRDLAHTLAKRNPKQRREIANALNVA
jgi:hypothetical protein